MNLIPGITLARLAKVTDLEGQKHVYFASSSDSQKFALKDCGLTGQCYEMKKVIHSSDIANEVLSSSDVDCAGVMLPNILFIPLLIDDYSTNTGEKVENVVAVVQVFCELPLINSSKQALSAFCSAFSNLISTSTTKSTHTAEILANSDKLIRSLTNKANNMKIEMDQAAIISQNLDEISHLIVAPETDLTPLVNLTNQFTKEMFESGHAALYLASESFSSEENLLTNSKGENLFTVKNNKKVWTSLSTSYIYQQCLFSQQVICLNGKDVDGRIGE